MRTNRRIGKLACAALLLAAACSSGTGSSRPAATAKVTDWREIPNCRIYASKVAECLGKARAESRPALEQSMASNERAWAQVLATAYGEDAVRTSCRAATDILASDAACK